MCTWTSIAGVSPRAKSACSASSPPQASAAVRPRILESCWLNGSCAALMRLGEMTRSVVRRVAVIGGGTIGTGIALDFALGGKDVVVCTRTSAAGRESLDRTSRSGLQMVEFGVVTAAELAGALDRIGAVSVIAYEARQDRTW
ncbi:3-hydroxyacyl-CoA dehydrogenase NAD-binding domain-containing protein [Amycolatopsis sp. NPDC059657]|uniref:3-hydroxyacyl-CoA dehydrogenase NAD-binding domain-containing protein n=1 Tax=Amycolatopsis sp. NPDC059657 TaxID=3346899 RepID=UPI00366EAF80